MCDSDSRPAVCLNNEELKKRQNNERNDQNGQRTLGGVPHSKRSLLVAVLE